MLRRPSKHHSGCRSLVTSIPIKAIHIANTSDEKPKHTSESSKYGGAVNTNHDVMKTPALFGKKLKRYHSCSGFVNKKLNKKLGSARKDCFDCSKCAKVYARKDSLLVHYRQSHSDLASQATTEEKYQCSVCGNIFYLKFNALKHCRKLHSGKASVTLIGDVSMNEFKCHKCGKRYASKSNLARHYRSKHGPIENSQCHECGKQYASRSNLGRHYRSKHGPIENSQCHECGKQYASKSNLGRHYRSKHEPIENLQCHECGKQYASRSNLARHYRSIHHNIKSLIQTEAQYNIDKHNNKSAPLPQIVSLSMSIDPVIVTSGSPGYKCPLCGKVLTRLLHFKNHMNLHTGICPYI